MAIKYECDKCGKIYSWYGTVNANKEYDEASWKEQRKMDEEDRAAGRYYGRGNLESTPGRYLQGD